AAAWPKIAAALRVSAVRPEGYNPLVNRLPGRWWAVAAALALLAGALWVRTGVVPGPIGGAIATARARALALRAPHRWAAGASVVALTGFVLAQAAAARERRQFAAAADAGRTEVESRATKVMAARLADEAERLRALAVRALDVPPDAVVAFRELGRLRGD